MQNHTDRPTIVRCKECPATINLEHDCFSRPIRDGHEVGYLCQSCTEATHDQHIEGIGHRVAERMRRQQEGGEKRLLAAVLYGDPDIIADENGFAVQRNRPVHYLPETAKEDWRGPFKGIYHAVTLSCVGLFVLCLFVIAIREALR